MTLNPHEDGIVLSKYGCGLSNDNLGAFHSLGQGNMSSCERC